jgi:hypothetical protein
MRMKQAGIEHGRGCGQCAVACMSATRAVRQQCLGAHGAGAHARTHHVHAHMHAHAHTRAQEAMEEEATCHVERVMSASTHYEVLQLKSNATEGDVKRARRSLALATHPDKAGWGRHPKPAPPL